MCCFLCCLVPCLWRLSAFIDQWLNVYFKPFHPGLHEHLIRTFMPGQASPRAQCEQCAYCCFVCPVECYRTGTGRDKYALNRVCLGYMGFLLGQADIVDVQAEQEKYGSYSDARYYWKFGRWPWDDQVLQASDTEESAS
ncbi:unnamed protein product [Protopolystoma xenopodis]|uniref:4Fe-4S ferredoxin-type domain-containing protein n=1 Tax=Protopolystoma xenopodis TaxID=117903 RepID=A0A448WH42_9PLAT|nr:unnamed protein product [Protopolystoma xenopodis]